MSLLLLLRPHGGVGGPVLPPAFVAITVDAATLSFKKDSIRISRTANGQDRLNFTVDSPTTSYRPALETEVILQIQGTTEFGGFVNAPRERGLGNAVGKHTTDVSALDYNSLATRRYLSATIPAGTLKAALEYIMPLLAGCSLDPAQADGPDLLELVYPLIRVDEFLNELSTLSNGWLWHVNESRVLKMYEPGTLTAPFNVIDGDGHAIGDVIVEENRTAEYANTVFLNGGGVTAYALDAGEQASHGIWELPVVVSEPVTQEVGDDLVAAWLARSLVTPKKVIYRTHTPGLRVGMTQTITLAARDLNNVFLVTAMEGYQARAMVSGVPTDIIEWQVTALEGIAYKPGWREYYKPGGNASWVTALGTGGGGSTFSRFVYPLGGTKLEPVRGTGTSWEFAGTKAQIDSVPRGTLSASISMDLFARAAGVGVKARLYDLTDSVACAGESATVTSTTPQFTTFTATLTAGSHIYQIQLQPNVANEDVLMVGAYAL